MTKTTSLFVTKLVAVLVCLGFLSVATGLAFSSPSVYADATSPHSADCSGSVSLSPSNQTTDTSHDASISANWNCEGPIHVLVNLDWGDKSTDSYTCFTNCGSGQTSFSHQYKNRGSYTVTAIMGGNASGSDSTKVQVN